MDSHLLRIGDVSKRTGKTVRAIHLYEELGLLQPATRSSGGFRLYEPSVVERVRWIELLRSLGFSLQEMRELVSAWWGAGLGTEAMDTLRALFKRKLEAARESVLRFQQLERELADVLEYLETCRACQSEASVADVCVRCKQDHGMTEEPALVAGLKNAALRPPARRARGGLVGLDEIG
jgi:MerR family transcriptional regulator, copper efflux regulator